MTTQARPPTGPDDGHLSFETDAQEPLRQNALVGDAAESLQPLLLLRAAGALGVAAVLLGLALLVLANPWPGGISGVFADWFRQGGWTHRSINVLTQGSKFRPVTPAVWAALWCALAGGIYAVSLRLGTSEASSEDMKRGSSLAPWLMIVAVPWLALDLRWQYALNDKHDRSLQQYGGKTTEQKLAASSDGLIFERVAAIKAVLPTTTERVLLVWDDGGDGEQTYLRVRALYHLWPHDNYGVWVSKMVANPRLLETASYLATIDPVSELVFDETRGLLFVRGKVVAGAERILAANGAALYRLTKQARR